MALTTVIDGFLTVAEVVAEIGRPTPDSSDPGYFADSEIEAIIQRYHDLAVEHAEKLAGERTERGEPPCIKELFAPTSIVVSPSTNQPGLLENSIGSVNYPFVLQVVDQLGRTLTYDDDLVRTARTAFRPKYRYKTVGNRIYVIGSDVTTVYAHLALKTDVWNYLFDGEMVRKYNDQILKEAAMAFSNIIQEGNRQENIFDDKDGIPGDLT